MRLLAVLGIGVFGTSLCCCGDLFEKLKSLAGGEEAAPPPVEAPAPVSDPVVEVNLQIGVPTNAEIQTPPPGVFLRYTSQALDVDKARQYHDRWFRENGWQVQVDQATATGWTLEAVNSDQRLIVNILPAAPQGVNVVFKLL